MRFYKIILIQFFLLLSLQCWKQQQHDIIVPEIPNYTLSGTIKDIDTGEIITESKINLTATSLVYADAEFNGAIDTSDTSGYYEFKGITPGEYLITVKRGNYKVTTESVVVEHRDKTFAIELPKALLAYIKYDPYRFITFTGICWIGSSTLAGVGQWKENPDDLARWRIVTGNYNSGFAVVGTHFWKENPQMWGLTYIFNYWTNSY